MSVVFLIIVVFYLYCDLSILRKQDNALFSEAFRFPRWLPVAAGGILLILIFGSEIREDVLSILFMTGLAAYTVKRFRFRRILKLRASSSLATDPKLFLASDALGVLLLWFGGMMVFTLLVKGLFSLLPQYASKLGELVIVSALSSERSHQNSDEKKSHKHQRRGCSPDHFPQRSNRLM